MMDRANDVINVAGVLVEKGAQVSQIDIGDELGLQTDQQGDLRRIGCLEPMGFVQEARELLDQEIRGQPCLNAKKMSRSRTRLGQGMDLFWI